MNGIFFFGLVATATAPVPDRVVGPVELAELSIATAREISEARCRIIVRRSSLPDENEGQKYFDVWLRREVHSFVRLAPGVDVPDADEFMVEGILRVWDVRAYTINGKSMPGWTMIRVESNAGDSRNQNDNYWQTDLRCAVLRPAMKESAIRGGSCGAHVLVGRHNVPTWDQPGDRLARLIHNPE